MKEQAIDTIGVLPKRIQWYNNPYIKFNICRVLKGREMIYLNTLENRMPIRKMKVHNSSMFDYFAEPFKFYKRFYNLYYSLAHIYMMPLFTMNLRKRTDETTKFCETMDKEYLSGEKKHLIGLDFAIDIDADSLEQIGTAWSHADGIKQIMDRFKVPYALKFSGNKGFHFTIDSRYSMKHFIKDKYDVFQKVREILEKKFNCVDLKGTASYTRVIKIPYNLDVASGLVALPLNDEQFNNFHPANMQMEEVLKLNLYNRGMLERQSNLSHSEKFINTQHFFKYIENGFKK